MMESIPNILALRYASSELKEIWSLRGKILMERDFWIAVMKAQKELGLEIPDEAIGAYEAAREKIDLDDIQRRESITRHDVKSRIDAFCDLAGYEHIHKGMTSRDLTENVEQLQVLRSLQFVRVKAISSLNALSRRAGEFKRLVITARTHNVAAQPTTYGRRLAMFGEEMLLAVERLDYLIENYPIRGLKGAVGNQLDCLTLFDGDRDKVVHLEERIYKHLGMDKGLMSTGQIYPRSLDFEAIGVLTSLASGPANFARSLRLMAGHELAGEGITEGQVGSSAMPHKVNSRSCERIAGFLTLLKGYHNMVAGLAGDQWNEGDVSCSVVRRVALPDSFFAVDGLLETLLVVLDEMEVFPEVIRQENERYLPFLATTSILMELIQKGVGRESAHELIREHAFAVLRDLRSGRISQNDFMRRLASDRRIGIDLRRLNAIIDRLRSWAGGSAQQVDQFVERVRDWEKRFPEAEGVVRNEIL